MSTITRDLLQLLCILVDGSAVDWVRRMPVNLIQSLVFFPRLDSWCLHSGHITGMHLSQRFNLFSQCF